VSERVATAVWTISAELVLLLDEHLGPPVDSYLNGSQTWLTEDGPAGVTLEWRLHPVSGYRAPRGASHYDVWETVVSELSGGTDPHALVIGKETRPLTSLWDGLECYAAFGDDVEPAGLATAAAAILGRAPDAVGLVDHEAIGDAWEAAKGEVSIVATLLDQLRTM
jgi:hypothetical protein